MTMTQGSTVEFPFRTKDGIKWKVTPDSEVLLDVDTKSSPFVSVWLTSSDLSEMQTAVEDSYGIPFANGGPLCG